jgi:hypothetical protein
MALSLKRDHPDVIDASVLLEPQVAYDDLIQVMDAIRTAETSAVAAATLADRQADGARPDVAQPGDPRPERVALFTDIALGDAP